MAESSSQRSTILGNFFSTAVPDRNLASYKEFGDGWLEGGKKC